MTEKYILDTHTLFWYLTASPKLGRKAKDIIEKILASGEKVIISVITFAELYYLNEKVGKPLDFLSEYKKLEEKLEIIQVEMVDILSFGELDVIEEMHDRLIVALTLRYEGILITKDESIRFSKKVKTLW